MLYEVLLTYTLMPSKFYFLGFALTKDREKSLFLFISVKVSSLFLRKSRDSDQSGFDAFIPISSSRVAVSL